VQVYVASDDVERVSAETLRDLVGTFDREVWPQAARLFGPAHDVDGDGRFTVLLTSRLEHFAAGRQPLDGFVRGADFDRGVAPPLGNGRDLMYLNATLKAGPHLRTVLAHEYTHAVIFSRKVLDAPGNRPGRDEDDWLDEALAHLVEDLHGFSRSNIDHRVRAFLAAPERYRLLVDDYFHGDLFRSHGHRGAAYLFLRWCRDTYGPGLLPALVTSPEHGIANLESATGEAFETLYRRWTVDLVRGPIWRSCPFDLSADALPALHWVEPGGESDCWSAEPTTSHFTVVATDSPCVVEVELTAPAEAGLQVSVLPLPDMYPHLALRPCASGSDHGRTRALTLTLESGLPVRIDAVRLEPVRSRSGEGARPASPVEIAPGELARWFGPRLILDPGRSVAVEPGLNPSALTGPTRIEVVGTDARGRPVVVRAELARLSDAVLSGR
jgi:hypothetical protein